MSEHTDLRHIMGVGIAITRGAAASLSFCYCLLLFTMSRNLITRLKEWSIQQYIPLDNHLQVRYLRQQNKWYPQRCQEKCSALCDEI